MPKPRNKIFSIVEKVAQSEDLGNKCVTGNVVRLLTDEEIIKTDTVSVLTDTGLLLNNVKITSDSPFSHCFPHTPENESVIGSKVIVAFTNGSIQQPFILKFLKETSLPTAASSTRQISWKTLCASFYDDQKGSTQVEFSHDLANVLISIPGTQSKLRIQIGNIIEFSCGSLSLDILRGVQLESQSIDISSETFTSMIETFKTEIQEMEAKVKKMKAELEECVVKAESFVLDSKDIQLSSDSASTGPVLFNQFETLMQEILAAIQAITVTCAAPGSPSSPPLNIAQFQSFVSRLKNLESKYIKID